MAETQTPPPVPETPAPPMSVREHIEAEARADAAPPEATAPTVPTEDATATPDAEREAASTQPDAEVSDAARTLRRNRADERKAKIQREIADLTRERYRVQAEVEQLRRARETPPEPPSRQPAPRIVDPSDPEPQETGYDDYTAFLDDRARWAARQEFKAQQQQSSARVAREAYERDLDTKVSKARETYADFDAVLDPFVTAVAGNPRDAEISAFIAASPHGADVLYRLAKDDRAAQAVLTAPSRAALVRELARLEVDVSAPPKAPKPITAAPTPPSQTVGGSASAQPLDTRKGVPLKDHIRIEEAEIAERRRQGYRY